MITYNQLKEGDQTLQYTLVIIQVVINQGYNLVEKKENPLQNTNQDRLPDTRPNDPQ